MHLQIRFQKILQAPFLLKKNYLSISHLNYEFVFSGFRPSSTFIKNFEKSGGKIVNDVSKKTTGLIVKDKHVKPTKKMQNAIKLGVSIYTVDEFINTFKEYKDILLM